MPFLPRVILIFVAYFTFSKTLVQNVDTLKRGDFRPISIYQKPQIKFAEKQSFIINNYLKN